MIFQTRNSERKGQCGKRRVEICGWILPPKLCLNLFSNFNIEFAYFVLHFASEHCLYDRESKRVACKYRVNPTTAHYWSLLLGLITCLVGGCLCGLTTSQRHDYAMIVEGPANQTNITAVPRESARSECASMALLKAPQR